MNAVVIVAGGSGRRLGSPLPKQYVSLGGKALVLHTIDRFFMFDPGIRLILVLAAGHQRFWEEVSADYPWNKEIILTEGGKARFDSVRNGLELVEDGWIVGIHDAVRPFVSTETIRRCYGSAAVTGSGIPVIEMDESVRMVGPGAGGARGQDPESDSGGISGRDLTGRSTHLDRSRLRRVQTPQVFRSEMIKRAYAQAGEHHYTDDASVFDSVYGEVTLVEGNMENIKVTTAVDLKVAWLLLKQS